MDNPTRTYYPNGNISTEHWSKNNKTHRLNNPAEIWYFENRNIEREFWYENDLLHRLDGPAHIFYNKDGNIHREYWYIDGKLIKSPFNNYPLTKEQMVEMKLTYG